MFVRRPTPAGRFREPPCKQASDTLELDPITAAATTALGRGKQSPPGLAGGVSMEAPVSACHFHINPKPISQHPETLREGGREGGRKNPGRSDIQPHPGWNQPGQVVFPQRAGVLRPRQTTKRKMENDPDFRAHRQARDRATPTRPTWITRDH